MTYIFHIIHTHVDKYNKPVVLKSVHYLCGDNSTQQVMQLHHPRLINLKVTNHLVVAEHNVRVMNISKHIYEASNCLENDKQFIDKPYPS